MWESFLECEAENFDVYIVAELLPNDKKEVTEDKGCKQIDNVGTSRAQGHRCLEKENEEGEWSQNVQL